MKSPPLGAAWSPAGLAPTLRPSPVWHLGNKFSSTASNRSL
ncbi:MAG: hypothetical protein ACXIUO_09625 [Erythrobacter sp.]